MEEDKKLWKIKYGYFKETIGGCFGYTHMDCVRKRTMKSKIKGNKDNAYLI